MEGPGYLVEGAGEANGGRKYVFGSEHSMALQLSSATHTRILSLLRAFVQHVVPNLRLHGVK